MKKKRTQLPAKYEQNFLAKLDGRIELARELKSSYAELTNDMGGVDSLSHVKRVLAERFVWLTAMLRLTELQIAKGNRREAGELLGRWIQGLNSLTGLARSLGMERKTRKVESLEGYIKSKVNRPKKRRRL